MNNSVNFKISLNDSISNGIRNIGVAFNNFTKQINGTYGQLDKFNNICSKLQFPNWSAQIDVINRAADAISSLSSPSLSFGQSIADLSSITGIAGGDLESLTEKARALGKDSGCCVCQR